MQLHDFDFMDLYVRLDADAPPRFKHAARDKGHGNYPLPPQYLPQVQVLIADLKRSFQGNEGTFNFGQMRFRVSVNHHANGETWAVLRRVLPKLRTLEDLHFAPHIAHNLRQLSRRDGLVLVSGATGAGKTTTMYGLLHDALQRNGGTAITIEDPVEYLMEGPVGDAGYCYQIQVNEDEEWASAIKSSLRWTPRYIMVGEIRTPRAAEQVLRAATTGHLVFTSVHAGSIEESIYGILHLAEQVMGSGAHHIMAAGITAAIHQTLTEKGPFIRYIFSEENNNGDPMRALIRENRIGMINTFIDKQTARLANQASSRKF